MRIADIYSQFVDWQVIRPPAKAMPARRAMLSIAGGLCIAGRYIGIMSCIFCQIAQGKMTADIIYQDDNFVVLKDINPKAKVHLLVVPKIHIKSINHLRTQHQGLIGQMFLLVKKIAKEQGFVQDGYKLIFNVGRGAGQIIEHLHLHILSGRVEGMP